MRFSGWSSDWFSSDLAVRLGLLVWTEIPLNGAIDPGEAFERNVARQMRELIAQNMNHPSVAVWGLGNEVYETSDDVLRVLRTAQATARQSGSAPCRDMVCPYV